MPFGLHPLWEASEGNKNTFFLICAWINYSSDGFLHFVYTTMISIMFGVRKKFNGLSGSLHFILFSIVSPIFFFFFFLMLYTLNITISELYYVCFTIVCIISNDRYSLFVFFFCIQLFQYCFRFHLFQIWFVQVFTEFL